MSIKVIDAFCGAGGMSLGLEYAGMEIIMAFDINEDAVRTYRKNFSHRCEILDARNLSGNDLLSMAEYKGEEGSKVNMDLVLVGGPPCQGFSVQGRNSEDDERNDLVFEYMRLVQEIKPIIFVMENVTGIRGAKGKKYFNKIKEKAEKLGYTIHEKVMNSAEFGVPQIRKRVFLVGEYRFPHVNTVYQFPQAQVLKENFVTVGEALSGLPSPNKNNSDSSIIPNHVIGKISELNKLRISYVPEGGGREHIPFDLQLECHKNSPPDKIGHRYTYGRLDSQKPSGTITARFDSFTRGKFAHPSEDRNITAREGARLQSFPDTFIFTGTKVEITRQIGNAVPPLLAQAIGESITKAISRLQDT